MDEIRTTIKKYYDDYKKKHTNLSIPTLLNKKTFKKLINKNIQPKTLTTWTYSNPDIKNIKKYCELEKNKIPYDLDSIKRDINYMPSIIKDNINIISRNMKLIDFNEQIKRLPMEFLN